MQFQVDELKVKDGAAYVVRDDLLEGGTKQRAIIPFLGELIEEGFTEFIYASPFAGFAQVALASAAKSLGTRCVIFCEETPDGEIHDLSLRAHELGACLISCSSLAEAEARATEYARAQSDRYKIQLGFNEPGFKTFLKREISSLWTTLTSHRSVTDLWLPVGSGTLAHVFRDVVPDHVTLHCVDVHVLKEADERIDSVRNLPNTSHHSAALAFHEACTAVCPVPSNAYYDLKVYEVFATQARPGDVWWNVAR